MNITQFPDEIIDQILNYIPKEYKNTSIICKQWNYIQSKTYFQTECNECNILNNAIKRDHVRCLKYFLKKQDEVSLCDMSAYYRAIKCLEYVYTHEYSWDERTCRYAASLNMNLEILLMNNDTKIM